MYHGHDMQEIIFAQLLEPVGQLLHIDILVPPVLLLGRVFAADTVCVGGAGFLEEGEQLRLRVAEGLVQEKLVLSDACPYGQLYVQRGAWLRSAPIGS